MKDEGGRMKEKQGDNLCESVLFRLDAKEARHHQ
jgi:hypothetical protein